MMKKRFLSQSIQQWKTLQRSGRFFKPAPDHWGIRLFLSAFMGMFFWADSGLSTAAAQQTRIAIAVDPEGRSCLLGGGVDGKRLSADLISKLLKPRQDFRLFNLRGPQSTILWPIGPPKRIEDNTCNPHFRQKLSLVPSELGIAQIAIFDSLGGKNIAISPKTLTVMSNDDEKYTGVLASFLERQKLKDAPIKIHQLIRTDLDGDGKFEVIINAINTARNLDRKGEYSIVLVVREVDGKTEIETIQNEVTLEDSDYPAVLWENTIAAIADIDGDGKMEIIMYGQFYHGQGWDLVKTGDGPAERPIICGCGG